MKASSLLVMMIIVGFIPAMALAEDHSDHEFSNTRRAAVVLRVTTDPKVFPMGDDRDPVARLTDLMFGPDVLQAAAREILDTSEYNEWLEAPLLEQPKEIAGLQTARIAINVDLPEQYKPAANEFLQAYIDRLKDMLEKEHRFGMGLYYNQSNSYGYGVIEAERHLEELKARQSQLAGGKGMLDQESVRRRIYEHERAVIENSMQRSMLERRSQELARRISESNLKSDITSAMTDKVHELHEVYSQARVDLQRLEEQRMKLFERGRKADGRGGMADQLSAQIVEAERAFSNAKQQIDGARERQEQHERMAAEEIQELNRQLRETTMQLEELEVQQSYLAGYSPGSISDSMDYEMLEVKIEAGKESLRRALIQAEEFQTQIRLLQPPVVSYDEIKTFEAMPKEK